MESGDPGGMTADEIGAQLVSEDVIPENLPNYIRPRLTELRKAGAVEVCGRRPGISGCSAAVWRLVR